MLKSPHITNAILRLCRYFKVKSHKFENWSQSPDGDLYMDTIIIENISIIILVTVFFIMSDLA
jgi:hypothetical protein